MQYVLPFGYPFLANNVRNLTDQLAGYAAYHRDRRNIVTHLIGIPMIVVAIAILLSRPRFSIGTVAISPAVIVVILTCVYYLKLDRRFGLVMSVLMSCAVAIGQHVAEFNTGQWLSWGFGIFVVGWVFQFVGHFFEGRKPAFVDDIVGLIIGPLFVVAEVGFWLGLRKPIHAEIEARFVSDSTTVE